MAKVTEYPRITKFKDNDILLVDGPDGTRTILQSDASKQMGGEVIMVNETAGDATKVVITTTDEDIELATMDDLESVETEVDGLKTQLIKFNSANLLPQGVNKTQSGITWSWNNGVCTVTGTHTGSSAATNFLIGATSSPVPLPQGIKAGETYRVKFKPVSNQLRLRFTPYNGTTALPNIDFYDDGEITIPDNADGILVLLRLTIGATVNETVFPCMLVASTNKELEEAIKDTNETINDVNDEINGLNGEINELKEFNSHNILKSTIWVDRTTHDVTFTKNENGSYTVSGTASASAFNNIDGGAATFPEGIEPGNSYMLKYDGSITAFAVIQYKNASEYTAYYYRKDNSLIKIHEDTVGVIFRLFVANSATVNETVHPYILNALSNTDLTKKALKMPNKTFENYGFIVHEPAEENDVFVQSIKDALNMDVSLTTDWALRTNGIRNFDSDKIYALWDSLQRKYSDYIDSGETIGYSLDTDGRNYKPIKAYYIHPRKEYDNTSIQYGDLQTVFITAGTHGIEGSPCWNLYTIFQRAFERGTIYTEFLHNRQFRIIPCLSRWSYDHYKRYLAAAYDSNGNQIVSDDDLQDYDANRQCICEDNTHPSYSTLNIHSYAGEALALTSYMNRIGMNSDDIYLDLHNCSYSLGYLTTDKTDIRNKYNAMVDTLAKDWLKYSPWKNGDVANYYETSTSDHSALHGKICAHESIELSYGWFFEKAYTVKSSNILEVQQYDDESCDSHAIAKGLDMTYRWMKTLLL